MGTDRGRTKRLAGAVMLGAATVLVPKADPEAHWSTPPVAAVDVVVRADDWSGLPDLDGLLTSLPPVRSRLSARQWWWRPRRRRRRR